MAKKDQATKDKAKKAKAVVEEVEEDEDEELDIDLEDLDLEDDVEDEEEEGSEYGEMNLKDLKALCLERGIAIKKKATEEDLIAALEADDEEDDEEEEEEEVVAPPTKKGKTAAPAKPEPKKAAAAPVKAKGQAPQKGVLPPMLQEIPEGALSTSDVAEMCGTDARKLRAVLRKEFYPDNESKRYYWMPGSKELNEILAFFGIKPKATEKAAPTKKKGK